MPRVYIIIVNWNGWQDTVRCLESLFAMEYTNFVVIVCDNASTDGSIEHLMAWSKGELTAPVEPWASLPPATFCPKPIAFSLAVAGQRFELSRERLVLLQVGENAGFAGGSNAGLRFAAQARDLDYAWLLNNDTVVDSAALSEMIRRMEEFAGAGLCGSKLLYFQEPGTIQALGGSTYNLWTGRGGHIGDGDSITDALPCDEVERRLKYIFGASVLVRASFLEKVGLLNPNYFLYFEEIDWAVRAKGCFRLAYAPASLVYHKAGSSTGSDHRAGRRSTLASYYTARSRALFTSNYYWYALPSVCGTLVASSIFQLFRGNWRNSVALLRGTASGLVGHARHSRLGSYEIP